MSIYATIQIDPFLLNGSRIHRKAIILSLKEIGDRVQNAVKKLPQSESFVDRSTHLRNSIVRDAVNTTDLSVKVAAGAEYGVFVNDGTYDKRAGGKGITPRRFMEKGLKKVEPVMDRITKKHIDHAY